MAIAAWLAAALFAAGRARAGIAESQVLVVYNSAAPEGTILKNDYLAAHPGIPAANVLDLNNPTMLAVMPPGGLLYSQFVAWVRDPIRNYLNQPGPPDAGDIIAIVLIRPMPHRIYDTDNIIVGDNPGALGTEFLPPAYGGAADATCASLDAELVLLWQDLDAGEAGGPMDSRADNLIVNPYHTSSAAIDSYSRANILTAKTLVNQDDVLWNLGGSGATALTPGDIYLVCRIDGKTLADARAALARSQGLCVNKARVRILMDKSTQNYDHNALYSPPEADPFYAGMDYEEARAALLADGWTVRFDATSDFIECPEETNPLIAYASYGENHVANPPGSGTYITCYKFAPGAIFNTVESFNGRDLNGLGMHPSIPQGQVADFLAAGGSFGIGHVWEPFSFSLPDNEFLFVNMLVNNMTWAEAAYTSIPGLSWQQIVLGDPLARGTILNDPGLPTGDMDGNGVVDGRDIGWFIGFILNGKSWYRASFPALDPVARGDFTMDFAVTPDDVPGLVAALLAP